MSQEAATLPLKRTSLHAAHVAAGAKMVPFGGWEMPVQYSGILDEHKAVRTAAGLFDVSHMGEFRVTGPDALALVQTLVANDVSTLDADQALYTQFTRPDGGTVDDLLVYRQDPGFLLVVNASNIQKDWDWIQSHIGSFDMTLVDESDDTAMLALQGPQAVDILRRLVGPQLMLPSTFRWLRTHLCGIAVTVARTGYTGEDGFEVFCAAADAPQLWQILLEAGADAGLKPAGLGARDTLRLEAGLPLYGHELTDTISPVMAGHAWSVKTTDSKGDFLGRDVLVAQKAGQLDKKVVGLQLEGRNIARQGYPVFAGDTLVGEVVSGTFSPTLQVPIATALVDVAAVASPLTVEIRGQRHAATVVKTPFYRRTR